ncbi:MAG: hypothetical protein ACRDP6_27600 [Actinoallomurus sp.]
MRRVSTIAAVAGISVALIAPAAGAAGENAGTGGWQPYRTQPFDSTDVCSFTIHGDIVKDEEETRIDATYPDGSAKVQEFRGPLVIRFTNTSTGASAVRDVSGYALLHFHQGGGSTWFFNGGGSIGVHAGNTATPPGSYIVRGTFVVTFAADGTRDIRLIHARSENLCTTLA